MTIHHLHIFLSSPGDVSRERQLAQQLIEQLQSERAHRDRLKIEVVAWDKPGVVTPMLAHFEPQEAIAQGLKKPSKCDIVIVIIWARMGTRLSDKYLKPDGRRYRSGTEYEFFDALSAAKKTGKPETLVYRRSKPPNVNLADPKRKEKEKQWELVEDFFAEFRNPDGSYLNYYQEYDKPSDFKYILEQNLRDLITQYLEDHPPFNAEFYDTNGELTWKEPPFPGLRAFTQEEALIFYGRGREIDELIRKLDKSSCRLLVVVGASGTGKSSLVAAGVLPALKKDAISGSKAWDCLRFTPGEVGDNPFMALANAFKPIIERNGHRPRDMAKMLEKKPERLSSFVAMGLEGKSEWSEMLLFIDQFEELFTLVDYKYQRPFINLLAVAAQTARLRTIMTMRADFYHRSLEWHVLDKLLAEGLYTLLAPKTGALHEMITMPAKLAGLQFEKGLAERILDDTGVEPGSLALMAFTLYELWQKSKGYDGCLTHASYESFNGVHGAIGKRAEDTFNSLIEENSGKRKDYETAFAQVFHELVEVDERGVAARRRARIGQLVKGTVSKALINALTEARLLIAGFEEEHEPMVEVAHEAIFTSWPRFKEWIENTIDDLRLLRQVRLAASEWNESGRAKHFLWPHERLLPVSKMLEQMRPTLTPIEKEFLRPESERLVEEIDIENYNHQERVNIGDRLAEIGDPRPGVGLRDDGLPDISWCEVPDGEITLEGGYNFHVDSFHISKYPVTWLQYSSFIEAKDGYRNKHWREKLTESHSAPGVQGRKLDNHPAENMSWYDAVAYCFWLTEHMGFEIRLPTEWEWQQAATGGDATNEWPWGAEFDSSRANTLESSLKRTIAVGLYPKGVSPVGAFDMSGNVREWCLNEYGKPARIDVSGYNYRVLRGGSWDLNHEVARCFFRNYSFKPSHRDLNIGFRLVSSIPIF